MSIQTKIVTAQEFQLIDEKGNLRACLSANDKGVSLTMLNGHGDTNLKLMVDEAGLSFLQLYKNGETKPKVDVSVDDKGTHLYLAGDKKQESYLFLKNGGASGVVLIDQEGVRKAQVLLSPDGEPNISVNPK